MRVLLISTYELGRQPFGLASPAAWLARAGAEVELLDLACQPLDESKVREADAIAFHLPMHTATRLALAALGGIRRLNPNAHLAFYGLYAPINEALLRRLGAELVLGGEFEAGLTSWINRLERGGAHQEPNRAVELGRQQFIVPERSRLPGLSRYARLVMPDGSERIVGATEASRGCKHRCRHCPIVPVYNGIFRIIQPAVVLADIRQQIRAGAEHITLGDPDFFNGIRHAIGIVTALHEEFPGLTYDVTIKIEHLLKHSSHLRTLAETGCLFVTSAVESVNDEVLRRLEKGHTRADFLSAAKLCREAGLILSPTFVAFTPWTKVEGYIELLRTIARLGLIENVAPIQLAIRLLIPAGSRLLELADARGWIGPFDEDALAYPWANPDSRADELCAEIQAVVLERGKSRASRRAIFTAVWQAAHRAANAEPPPLAEVRDLVSRAAIPYLTEPWYC